MRVRWPRTRKGQAAIAIFGALLSASWTFVKVQYGYFERFYFGPHKGYPYPYPNAHAADLALFRDCSLALGVAFVGLMGLQRLFAKLTGLAK